MTAWNGPLVGSDSLDIDHILYGKGSYWEREQSHFQFYLGPTAPSDTKRPRIRRELIEIYRLAGSDRKTEVGTPLKKFGAG